MSCLEAHRRADVLEKEYAIRNVMLLPCLACLLL